MVNFEEKIMDHDSKIFRADDYVEILIGGILGIPESHNEKCNSIGEQDEIKLFDLANWLYSLSIKTFFRLRQKVKILIIEIDMQ